MRNSNFKNKISIKGLLPYLLIASLSVLYVCYTWNRIEAEQSEYELQIARSIVAAFPSNLLITLEAKANDIEKPQYHIVKNILNKIIQVNSKARFAYLYTIRDNKIYFIADSEPINSKDCSPPGQEYTEADSNDIQQFINGNSRITEPMADRWGTWVSVLIPIKEPSTGKTTAIFGVDFSDKVWSVNLLVEVIESCALVVLLILVLFIW